MGLDPYPTEEVVQLPPVPATSESLLVEDDGDIFIVVGDQEDIEPEMVEFKLRFRLFVSNDGQGLWVRDMVARSPAWLLDTMRQQHVQRRLIVKIPPCSAEVSLDCAIYVMRMAGFYVRFSLLRLFYALGFSSYNGQARLWVRSSADALTRRGDKHGLPSSLHLSRQYANSILSYWCARLVVVCVGVREAQ